jgi:hypothetical protein
MSMLADIVNAAANLIQGIWGFFQNVAPHGFGIILVPLLVLGGITLWAARKQ